MLAANNAGIADAIPAQLRQARGHGFTFVDSIFPLLLAVGLSMPLSRRAGAARHVGVRIADHGQITTG